jgi:anti-sigma B factor antagonist
MDQPKVRMSTRKLSEKTSAIDISGEVTAAAENPLMDAYTDVTTAGARNVILNFEGLDYMNSSGIGLLVTLLIRAQRQKQRLMAAGLSDHYQQIFELTRLNEAITIFPTVEDAAASVS